MAEGQSRVKEIKFWPGSTIIGKIPRSTAYSKHYDEDDRRQSGLPSKTMAATKSTLETTELLETIILNLPLRSVLRLQRVSHLWRATILTSIKIQQALFIRSVQAPTTRERVMQQVTLKDSCLDTLSVAAPRTIVNNILNISGSASSISHLSPTTTFFPSKGSWQKMQLTQPPTTSDFLAGNFIALTASEALDLSKDSFVPSEASKLCESSHSMTHGSFSRMGAIHLQSPSGLTLEMVAQGIAQLQQKFQRAEHKGRGLRLFWGSQVKADLMVDLLMEIAECVEEDVRRMRCNGAME